MNLLAGPFSGRILTALTQLLAHHHMHTASWDTLNTAA